MPRPMSASPSVFGTARARAAFRVTAIVEACTWVGLLIGMAFKYLISGDQTGVHVFGPLHGVAFLAYCASTVWAALRFGWPWQVALLGLAASLPPLGSWVFEAWTLRTGRLDAAYDRDEVPATV